SFFMYNQNGQQAIARPMLDGLPPTDMPGPSPSNDWSAYPKYDEEDTWDIGTRAPSSNFVYAFEHYRFFVHDNWQEVFAHDSKGTPTAGTLDRLVEAFRDGCEVKVGISGLYADLAETDAPPLAHEVFVQIHSGYYGTDRRIFSAGTHPLVRVRPRIPARYETGGWDFGWVMTRSDGFVARWLCHPYTLQFHKSAVTAAIRWFVR
ncbi:MAG: hypothetical protein FJY97_18645, partial [candidate division Zixibacteria bacterium]|nr:hypothetical protein [candidate division Zixibacteria bacterium]